MGRIWGTIYRIRLAIVIVSSECNYYLYDLCVVICICYGVVVFVIIALSTHNNINSFLI